MTITDDTLDKLAPLLYAEGQTGNALTTYIEAVTEPFLIVEEWASETDDGPGYSLLLDIDLAPDEALPWLGQLIGMKVDTSLSAADQRLQLHNASNWKRGTPGAIGAAPGPYLTGTKTVILRERYNGTTADAPYYLEVVTYDPETPDPAKVLAAIMVQKPTGIQLTYAHLPGQDYQHLKDTYATYQAVKNRYVDYASVRADF